MIQFSLFFFIFLFQLINLFNFQAPSVDKKDTNFYSTNNSSPDITVQNNSYNRYKFIHMSIDKFIPLILALSLIASAKDISQSFSPDHVQRVSTIWEWCDCQNGTKQIIIWPNHQTERNITIQVGAIKWIQFDDAVSKVSWKCDGMKHSRNSYVNLQKNQWVSVLIFEQTKKGINNKCQAKSGRISLNTWNTTTYISSIPFTSHTEGYSCFKIPTLLKTEKGALIAFSEARKPGCDDFDRTDLVYKRSVDNGRTWSPLKALIEVNGNETGECNHQLVIGNISPLQLTNNSKYPGRIIAPYTRNNFKLWITHSDDDGLTWTNNKQIPNNLSRTAAHPDCNRNMSYFGLNIDQLKLRNTPDFVRFFRQVCTMKNPYDMPAWTSKLKAPWQFIGVGPSQSLQLKSGRILVPGYFSPIRGLSQVPGTIPVSQLLNNFDVGFVLISDDSGDTWRLGKDWPVGQGSNQHQIIQLDDGTVLSNSRSLSTGSPQFRLQARSFTDGQTFTSSEFTTIPQPFAGCQGSTAGGIAGKVFVTSPNPQRGRSVVQYLTDALGCRVNLNGRQRLSLWTSRDNGKSYKLNQVIDPGLSAQTSLQYVKGKLYLLYEQADPLPKTLTGTLQNELIRNLRVLVPTRFVYRQLPIMDEFEQTS